jgi:hypothetical protein
VTSDNSGTKSIENSISRSADYLISFFSCKRKEKINKKNNKKKKRENEKKNIERI